MKHLIALLTLSLATWTANASMVNMEANQKVGNDFEAAYSLDTFQIGAGSFTLPRTETITSGSISFNHQTQEVRVTLSRHTPCAANTLCSMVMPAPTSLTLPAVQVTSGLCGGTVIVAEETRADGSMVSMQINDENSDFCEKRPMSTEVYLKRIHVKITEKASPDSTPIVSTLSGFPLRAQY